MAHPSPAKNYLELITYAFTSERLDLLGINGIPSKHYCLMYFIILMTIEIVVVALLVLIVVVVIHSHNCSHCNVCFFLKILYIYLRERESE